MSGRTTDRLPRLPSVGELLEKPPVRDLVQQLNRSTVVTGARSYLEQLRGELQERFAHSPIASPSELAERAARYILGPFQQRQRIVINATGHLVGDQWATIPLGTVAQDALVVLASGYSLKDSDSRPAVRPGAIEMLCSRSGAEDAVVAHSYAGALWLVLSTLAAGREALVARGELGLADESSLSSLIAASGARLVEVGATNRASAADYESIIGDATAIILRARSDDYRVAGRIEWATHEELVALARDRELIYAAALDRAALDATTLGDDAHDAGDCSHTETAAACISAGADLVILRGEGLLGGPACGVILGRGELLERIREYPMFGAWQIDALRLAALAESLRSDRRVGNGTDQNMIRKLWETPVENLQHRAHRLTEQLAEIDDVASTEAVPLESCITECPVSGRRLNSYGVRLTPHEGRLDSLVERLASAAYPVVGRVERGGLVLDLRTVLPDQDQQIVAALSTGPQEQADGSDRPVPAQAAVET